MLSQITQLFIRDLERLKDELNAYENEADIWKLSGEISNTAGNLTLHLVGNLNHFIGARIGNTGYVRQRESEFSEQLSREDLLQQITETQQMVKVALGGLTEDDLKEPHPIEFIKTELDLGSWLMYLSSHFNYHLGQINYHRRLI